MAEETANGSITLSDPNNGPLARWAVEKIEAFTNGSPVGAGYTTLANDFVEGKLVITIERAEQFDAIKEADHG